MSRHASFAFVVAMLGGLAACGSFDSSDPSAPTNTPDSGGPTADSGLDAVGGEAARGITLTAGEAGKTVFVMQGKTATAAVKLVRRNGSVGPVAVTVKNLPTGVTADALTIAAGANDATLTLHAASTAPQGLTSLDIAAVESVANGASATAKLDAFVRGLSGTLDTTFGTEGVFKNVFASGTSGASDARILKNGSIVISGHRTNTFTLVRLTPAGVLDTTFGGGAGRANIGGGQGELLLDVHEGASTADSFISALAVGAITPSLMRSSLDGLAATAFGGTGQVPVVLGLGNASGVQTIASPDGTALVLSNHFGTTKAGVVSRWKPDGTLDTAYGSAGTCQLTGSGTAGEVSGTSRMFPQPSGGVRVALSLGSAGGAMKGCSASGAVDTSLGTVPDYFRAVPGSIDATPYFDGGILFLGGSAWGRVNAAFLVDTGLGNFGSVTTTPEIPSAVSVVGQTDGSVIVAGTGVATGTFVVMRFKATGIRDPDFATAGVATITVATNNATMTRMVAQPDGRLLLLGRDDDMFDGVIARIWP